MTGSGPRGLIGSVDVMTMWELEREDSIPASGPQCEPYNSKMETEQQPGICARTGRVEGRNTKTKTFSTDATTHHKQAIDGG